MWIYIFFSLPTTQSAQHLPIHTHIHTLMAVSPYVKLKDAVTEGARDRTANLTIDGRPALFVSQSPLTNSFKEKLGCVLNESECCVCGRERERETERQT